MVWVDACAGRDLGRRPLGIEVGGRPIVLFRDEAGRPRALDDACPHRGVPLSLGRCRGGRIACAYHGWEFDGEGVCRLIPSNVEPTAPRPMARSLDVREVDGRIEVCVQNGAGETTPWAPSGAGNRLPGPRRPRWATPDDNAALVELVRSCPMRGSVQMYFDRAPDYFALSRLQGEGARVAVIDDREPGRIAAAAAMADFPAVYVDGQVRSVPYACDLRVHPGARGGLLVKRLYDFMTAWSVERGWDLGFTTIMRGNEAMAGILAGKGGLVPYRHVTTMRNHLVGLLLPKRPPAGIAVRPARPEDVPAIVALWNRVQRHKNFAPVWTEDDFCRRLATFPGLSLESYLLAFRNGLLTGFLVAWSQEAFKRMVVLGYDEAMRRMRSWYNPLAAVLRLCPMPPVGQAMPYFYATHLCAESAADLRALYVGVYNANRQGRKLFFSTMLDVRDPLAAALEGFVTQHVDIELHVMDPLDRYREHRFDSRPCYFDPAIV